MISALVYDELGVTNYEAPAEAKRANGVTWIRATEVSETERRTLVNTFGLHSLSIEGLLESVRAKTEEYPDYTFVLLKSARLASGETSFGDEIETTPLGVFVGADWLLTLSKQPIEAVDRVYDRIVDGDRRLHRRGPDFLAYRVLDLLVDGYFDLLDELEDRIERIEEAVLTTTDTETLAAINEVRRELLAFRKLVWPARGALGTLARGDSGQVEERTEKYYRDAYDHLVQIVDLTETYRDLVGGARDIYLNTLSQSTNEVMKTLTVVATIVLPLTLVVGVFGMNFQDMPEYGWPLAYPAVVIGMVGIALVLVVYYERQGYL